MLIIFIHNLECVQDAECQSFKKLFFPDYLEIKQIPVTRSIDVQEDEYKYSNLFITCLNEHEASVPNVQMIRRLLTSSSVYMIVCHFKNLGSILQDLFQGIFLNMQTIFFQYSFSGNIYLWSLYKFSNTLYSTGVDSKGDNLVDNNLVVILAGNNKEASTDNIMSWEGIHEKFQTDSARKLSMLFCFYHFHLISI